MKLEIVELAREYKHNRDEFLRARPKTRKKIRAFEQWLNDYHLNKNDIIDKKKGKG